MPLPRPQSPGGGGTNSWRTARGRVSYMRHCSCNWWHLLEGLPHVVMFISRAQCYLCLSSRGLWKSLLHELPCLVDVKEIFLDSDLVLRMDRNGLLLTFRSHFNSSIIGYQTQTLTPYLKLESIRCPTHSQVFEAVKVVSVEQTSCGGTAEEKQSHISSCWAQTKATWQAPPCHDLRFEAAPMSWKKLLFCVCCYTWKQKQSSCSVGMLLKCQW